jgi:hypothetical protein
MAKSEASSLSSAEVGRLWEEPTEEIGPTSDSVGILAVCGGEDVNGRLLVCRRRCRKLTDPRSFR